MITVYKYPMKITGKQTIQMPEDSLTILVAEQNGTLCMWAEVDTESPLEEKEFYIYGTGHEISHDGAMHLGSAVVGNFVWHVYM